MASTTQIRASKEQRHYASVAAGTTSTVDYTIPNGSELVFKQLGGSSSGGNSNVQIIWDPAGANQLVFATYGTQDQPSDLTFTGNGTKVMRIKLTNAGLTAQVLGAYFLFDEITTVSS